MPHQDPEVKKYKYNHADNAPVQPAGMAGEKEPAEGLPSASTLPWLPVTRYFFLSAWGNAYSVPSSQATGRLRASTY